MKRKKRPPRMGTNQRHSSTTTHQQNVTHFQENQKPLKNNSFDQPGNKLHFAGQQVDSPEEKRMDIQTQASPNKTYRYWPHYPSIKSAATLYSQPVQRRADVKFILIGCVAFAFMLWVLAALYELVFTGNGSLINSGGEAVPFTLFMMVLNHFLHTKKEEET